MIPHLRKDFNTRFSPEKYRRFLSRFDELGGTHIEFRLCETPCFFPRSLVDTMARHGQDLIRQLVDPSHRTVSDAAIPSEYCAPGDSGNPLFIAVDFGLVKDDGGNLQPKLVEIQGFPSLYAYQVLLAEQYREVYGLVDNLGFFLGGLGRDSYLALLRRAILAGHDPLHVVLLEIDPYEQKTLVDFLLTEREVGIPIVNITDVEKEGKHLFYRRDGKRVRIERIYNRAIIDELVRKGKKLNFSFRDELDVEWAGHPNWFFRISKFSIPFLRHECVPRTQFVHEIGELPPDPHNYVLKPLFSFAGLGVIVGPTLSDIQSIPAEKRKQYILQERVDFAPIIETPYGPTKAEVRVMYIWLEDLRPVLLIIRMGRGKMMGVDHNRNMEWVGASAGFVVD